MLEIKSRKDYINIGVINGVLDISQRYTYTDKEERTWRFSFERLGGDEGWFAWLTRPGQKEICIGKISDQDLAKALKENPPPLDQGDLIDLELWLIHDGLDAYQPKVKKTRKPRTKKEITE